MEVMLPTSPTMDFDFNSSPRSITAPSTPRRLGDCFFSAPTSPSRLSEFYREFDRFSMMSDVETSHLTIPFDWEEKPGTPKSRMDDDHEEGDDFAFDFSAALEKTSVPAEELFDGGRIKPLKPPPRFKVDDYNNQIKSPLLSSPRSSPFSQGKRMIREAFSPKKQKEVRDPFATAIETSRNDRRGRERVQDFSMKSSSRRATRSLSPYRVSTDRWENDDEDRETTTSNTQSSSTLNSKPSFSSNPSSSKGSSRKWRLRDLLLFRSASEGRAADKDPLRKYSMFFKKHDHQDQNKKNPSSNNKSTDRSSSRRKVSAHELHYTANKAASENMKKKTFLPYKQVILGRLAFHADGFGK